MGRTPLMSWSSFKSLVEACSSSAPEMAAKLPVAGLSARRGHLRVHEHVVDEPLHAVGRQRLEVLAGRQPPRLPLHVGQGAHEQHAAPRGADGLDDAGDEQVRDDGGEQRPRAQHDEVGLADGLKRRLVRARRPAVLGGEPHLRKRRLGMAGHGLTVQNAPVLGLGRQHHVVQRRGIHVPLGVHQLLADGDGLGKRPRRIFQRGQKEVAQSMVAGHGEAVLERPHKRVGGILRKGHEALADVAGRCDVGLLAQNTGAAAVVGHGHDGARLHA